MLKIVICKFVHFGVKYLYVPVSIMNSALTDLLRNVRNLMGKINEVYSTKASIYTTQNILAACSQKQV